MGASTNIVTVIFVCLGLVLLWAVIAFPGQGMVAVGVLMIFGGGFGLMKAATAMNEIPSMILFVGGGLTVGVGLAVIQLQEVRRLLTPTTTPPTPTLPLAKDAEWVDPWKPKPNGEPPTDPAQPRSHAR